MTEEFSENQIEELNHRARRACSALKIFPLPGVVLYPGIPVPLHVFEPRYRALLRDALAGDRMLAIATLVDSEDAPLEHARVHPLAGACLVEMDQALPDGRFEIVVRGAARVKLVEELDRGQPYREFRAEVLEDHYPPGGPAAVNSEAEMLRQCVFELSSLLPPESGARQLAESAARQRSPGVLADLVAAAVVSEPEDRVALLAELDVRRRLERATTEVAGVILMLSRGRSLSV